MAAEVEVIVVVAIAAAVIVAEIVVAIIEDPVPVVPETGADIDPINFYIFILPNGRIFCVLKLIPV